MDFGLIISGFFVNVIFPVLGAIVLTLIGIFFKKTSDKLGIEINIEHQQRLEELAIGAIGYAEELAADRAKQASKITGSEKMDLALGWFMSQAPEVDRAKAREWISSMLALLSGPGATGEKTAQ